MPPKAGWKKPSAAPKSSASTMIAPRLMFPLSSSARNTDITAARARSDEIMSRRRE